MILRGEVADWMTVDGDGEGFGYGDGYNYGSSSGRCSSGFGDGDGGGDGYGNGTGANGYGLCHEGSGSSRLDPQDLASPLEVLAQILNHPEK